MSDRDAKLRELQESILHAPEQADIVSEAMSSPVQQSLPVTWKDAHDKVHLPGAPALVKTASHQETAQYAYAPTRVCGTCKYFDLSSNARKALVEQRFAERLIHEEKWKLKFLGVPMDNVGLCGASNGEKATTTISNAGDCDQYRPIRFKEAR